VETGIELKIVEHENKDFVVFNTDKLLETMMVLLSKRGTHLRYSAINGMMGVELQHLTNMLKEVYLITKMLKITPRYIISKKDEPVVHKAFLWFTAFIHQNRKTREFVDNIQINYRPLDIHRVGMNDYIVRLLLTEEYEVMNSVRIGLEMRYNDGHYGMLITAKSNKDDKYYLLFVSEVCKVKTINDITRVKGFNTIKEVNDFAVRFVTDKCELANTYLSYDKFKNICWDKDMPEELEPFKCDTDLAYRIINQAKTLSYKYSYPFIGFDYLVLTETYLDQLKERFPRVEFIKNT